MISFGKQFGFDECNARKVTIGLVPRFSIVNLPKLLALEVDTGQLVHASVLARIMKAFFTLIGNSRYQAGFEHLTYFC